MRQIGQFQEDPALCGICTNGAFKAAFNSAIFGRERRLCSREPTCRAPVRSFLSCEDWFPHRDNAYLR
jgi:hypothetical protein